MRRQLAVFDRELKGEQNTVIILFSNMATVKSFLSHKGRKKCPRQDDQDSHGGTLLNKFEMKD